MLEEIIAGFLMLFSSFTMDIPQVISVTTDIKPSDKEKFDEFSGWHNRTHMEYGQYGTFQDLASSVEYVQISGDEPQVRYSYVLQSLLRSLKANLSITLAVLFLALLGIIVLYFDLKTMDLCFEWRSHNNTIPFAVMTVKFLGDGVEAIVLNQWLPLTTIVLFGWSKFKRYYWSTVILGLIIGLIVTLYFSLLLRFGVYDSNVAYRIPGNVLFAFNLIFGCKIVVQKIRQAHPNVSYTNVQIMTVVSAEFLASFVIAMFYRYAAVPWFNSLDNEAYKFIVAALTPLLTLIPVAICRHVALWRCSEFVEPERSFVLVYFMRGASITLYRIMQADFKSLWLFIALSLFSGFVYLFRTATIGLRARIWARVMKFLRKGCCTWLKELPADTPHHRRLKADTEIQNVLFENNTIILSQAYLVLYRISSFDLTDWAIIKGSCIRIAIGLVIEFFFNFLSIFVFVHWYNVPIPRVWSQFWRRHVFANAVILVIIVFYFTEPLLTVFQYQKHEPFPLKNCTLPY